MEDKERSELELKVELDVLKEELERLRCSEDTMQTRVAGKDKRIAHLEEKISELKESKQKRAEAVSRFHLHVLIRGTSLWQRASCKGHRLIDTSPRASLACAFPGDEVKLAGYKEGISIDFTLHASATLTIHGW